MKPSQLETDITFLLDAARQVIERIDSTSRITSKSAELAYLNRAVLQARRNMPQAEIGQPSPILNVLEFRRPMTKEEESEETRLRS